MSDRRSGFPCPSGEATDPHLRPSWSLAPTDETSVAGSKAAFALTLLREKLHSGALAGTEFMQRIVAQAAAGTGAKGVALALRRERNGVVACCASSGAMAPPPGTLLDQRSGFTAECLRNGVVMVCDDSQNDAHVDRDACRRLGVRSLIAVPLESQTSTVGVLEAFSDEPAAFSQQHIEFLVTLACLAKSAIASLEWDCDPVPLSKGIDLAKPPSSIAIVPQPKAPGGCDLAETIDEIRIWAEPVPWRIRLAIVSGVAAAMLLALLAMAILVWMWRHNSEGPPIADSLTCRPQLSALAKLPAGNEM